MKRSLLPLLLPAVLCAGLLTRLPADPRAVPGSNGGLQVFPFGLMSDVRRTDVVVPMQVQLYNGGDEPLALREVTAVTPAGAVLAAADLGGERLAGDGGVYLDLLWKLELADPDLTHRHKHRLFVPLEERRPLDPAREARLFQEITAAVRSLQASGSPQIRNVRFDVDLARLFGPAAQPGDEAVFDVVVRYRAGRRDQEAVVTHAVRLRAPYLPPPPQWYAEHPGRSASQWVSGDLHVHNCRDQALLGCPNCAAESVNVTGSYTNAQLKAQYVALGIDYFSSSTHSYCINSDSEFNELVTETAQLDDPAFAVLTGTEITGKETGPQTGSDLADALCYLGFGVPVYHMGGHGITSRKPGGKDGFLDLCDRPVASVMENTARVNAEGGFTIANHPTGAMWALNSWRDATGIEANGLRGSEVMNGTTLYTDWWVNRMLAGRMLYAYSGSDTHDAAYDWPANHTLVDLPFTDATLLAGLKAGRNYISDGPFLAVALRDPATGRTLEMGAILNFPANGIPNNYPIQVEAFYNAGSDVVTVRFWRGIVGEASEVLLQEIPNVSGAGTLTVPDTVVKTARSWYRVQLEPASSAGRAYTSPIFLIPR